MSDVINQKIDELVTAAFAEGKPKWCYGKAWKPGQMIPYSGPYFDEEEIREALKTFLLGNWLVSGETVSRFQMAFSKQFGVRESHMVNSGSSANLVLIAAAKKYFGWNDGDEIIVSPVGFPTTIAPIVQNGLKPAFVDIEFETLNFSIEKILESINSKTKAIFVSPVLGNSPDLDWLASLASSHGLVLLGDNCDSLGSKWKGKFIHDYYFAWSCSFYPAHHISTGEGGMVSSNDGAFVDLARKISWWGRDCYCVGQNNLLSCGTCGHRFDKWLDGYDGIIDHKYLFSEMGYNLKPLDLQGAFGLAQLKKFPVIDSKRRENKLKWERLLTAYVKGIRVAKNHPDSDPSWFGVPIICDTQQLKEELQFYFEDSGIQTRTYFAGNLLLHPGYKHLDDYRKYPEANKALSHVFFVGCPPHYTDETFAQIEKVLQQWKN